MTYQTTDQTTNQTTDQTIHSTLGPLAGLALLLVACFGPSSPPPIEEHGLRCTFSECSVRERGPIDPAGEHVQYVIDTITFTDAEPLAPTDLDCDGAPDHALDAILRQVYQDVFVTDLQAVTQETVDDGRILHLIDVQTTDLEEAIHVGLQVHVGIDGDGDPDDNFSGSEQFTIDASAPTSPLAGSIHGGQIAVDIGTIPLQIALPGVEDTFVLELSAGFFEGSIAADRLSGTMSGSLTADEVENGFLPVVHATMTSVIDAECTPGCPPNSRADTLLGIFDNDNDGVLAFEEVRDHPVVQALLQPDVDVLDSAGNVNPSCDEELDSLSFAVHVTGVPARF